MYLKVFSSPALLSHFNKSLVLKSSLLISRSVVLESSEHGHIAAYLLV